LDLWTKIGRALNLIDRYFICQAMLIFLDRTTGGGVSTSDMKYGIQVGITGKVF
jgi:hypothetical protein